MRYLVALLTLIAAAADFEVGLEGSGWVEAGGRIRTTAHAHDSKGAVHLYSGAAIEHTTELDPGVYELTVWATGGGKILLSARAETIRVQPRNLPVGEEYALYGLSFEVLDAAQPLTLRVASLNGDVLVDDITVGPAPPELVERWEKAVHSHELLGYFGIEPNRPPPRADSTAMPDLDPAKLAAWRITETVVFFDSEYDTTWIEEPQTVAHWFVRRGVDQVSAPDLKSWLEARDEDGQGVGSSVIMIQGLVPSDVVYPPFDDCLLARYMKAGGRVVWLANAPMYVHQGATGTAGTYGTGPREQMLGLVHDRRTFYGAPGPAILTGTAKAWGLEPGLTLVRPVLNRGLTACFAVDETGNYCGAGLANLNPEYPLSGFIFEPKNVEPGDEALFRNAYRMARWAGEPVKIPAPTALPGEAAGLRASLRFGAENRRQCFLRGEDISLYLRIEEADAPVTVRLHGGEKGSIVSFEGDLAGTGDHLVGMLNLNGLKVGRYPVRAVLTMGDRQLDIEREVLIAPPPDHQGTHIAIWGNPSPIARRAEEHFAWLQEHRLEPMFVDGVNDYARDMALWHGMSFSMREHGHPEPGPANPPGYDSYRRGASGEIMRVRARGDKRDSTGYGSPFRQRGEAGDFGDQMRIHAQFPAFDKRAVTGDDYSQWFGLDYNRFIVEGFRARYGFDPPRPEEAQDPYGTPDVKREPGIIPDDDPWVLLNRYWSETVLGGMATRVADEMRAATDGEGKVGPIPGGMQIPVMQLWSSQYPPFNFGRERGWNLLCFYYYNTYWQPPLAHHWWLACARMGNRDMEQWIMPDCYTMGDLPAYYEHSAWQILSGGATGLEYFIWRPDISSGARQALRHFGGLSEEYGQLMGAIQPQRRRVGMLIPFPQLVYRIPSCISLAYPYFDLLQAQVDVEPVAVEELDAREITRYDTIVVAQIDWLRESTVELLAAYAAGGGKVLVDQSTHESIAIPGAVRLPLTIGAGNLREYADVERIAAVRAAVAAQVPAAFPSRADDPHIVVQPFGGGGRDFAWLVHVQTQDAYLDLWKPTRKRPIDEAALRQVCRDHGWGEQVATSRVSLEGREGIAWDVIGGRALGDAAGFDVEIPYWQGMLVAVLPAVPDGIEVLCPLTVVPGQAVDINATVVRGDVAVPALFPLHLEAIDPAGEPNREYTRRRLARDGRAHVRLRFAANDLPGEWRFRLRDAMTRAQTEFTVTLKPPQHTD